MSKKKLTPIQIRKLEEDYYEQMNILNGHHELYDAVTKYVAYLISKQKEPDKC